MAFIDMIGDIPDVEGLYSIWSGDKLLYIGTSASIKKRLKGHSRRFEFDFNKADSILFIAVTDKRSRHARYRMEHYLIKKHRPLLNIAQGRPKWGKATI